MGKYVYFNNLKFTRDDKTGYYRCSKTGERLHRYVWKYYHGEIPKGYQIHHIDENKDNNDISNLQLIDRRKHAEYHSNMQAKLYHDRMAENLKINAIPKAKEWHGSKDGIEWHKKHYEAMKDKLHVKEEYKCKNCEKVFLSNREGFCSNNCKSAYRRKMGLDNVKKECEICGKEFISNKYYKTRCCSRSCANKIRAIK